MDGHPNDNMDLSFDLKVDSKQFVNQKHQTIEKKKESDH